MSLKRLRDVAEQSEQKYHDLYNAVPIGNVLLNAQGMVVELNQAGARLLGKEKDRILKTEFTAHISPEFRNHFRDLVKRVIDNDSSESMEIRIPITDNPACLVAIDAGPVENYITESRLCRILMTDVTESPEK